MNNVLFDCTKEEFEKFTVLSIKIDENSEEKKYFSREFNLVMLKKFFNKMLKEKRISIVEGNEEYFKEFLN